MSKETFEDYEIPYEALANVGFSKESIESLPEDVFRNLLAGQFTPLLTSAIKDDNGSPLRASIKLFRDENGNVDAVYRPYKQFLNLEEFTEDEKASLLNGQVIRLENDGNPMYYQFDESTNQITKAPVQLIDSNIEILKRNLQNIDTEAISDGQVVETTENGYPITAGIDLSAAEGIRIANGDKAQWLQEKKGVVRNEYSFGLYGCWITDKDNGLSYVPEDEYNEVINKAMEDQMEKNKEKGARMGM